MKRSTDIKQYKYIFNCHICCRGGKSETDHSFQATGHGATKNITEKNTKTITTETLEAKEHILLFLF